ncbi:hypothetical protein SPRG_09316 [Saprolegnia parasitica CBS 223.65]|uniref:Uncharacterized protein n=1 Tax=Saprolegnia parasitica (strain CBS 223.65) TaxID=695850 RepID=A0A067C877_SAPPC|nr:hypothetical protein SPRG_09316 [Saprolegnia parasitica CBS 223.65]KDO25375.1 hypothetical protein SPRG_09316 [Saprolegnia parasitica CBS 223.65]|eukprot:XP_012203803.1 hypothetical protein SPRG_09316 [Saprolegnia parasitica CBS 223.65]
MESYFKLLINSANFAVAPPYFVDNPTIAAQVARVFPGLANSSTMVGITHLLLASLVYHYDYLVSTLPPTHAPLSSILFTGPTIRASLAPLLTPRNDATMLVTGVLPYVEIYRNLKKAPVQRKVTKKATTKKAVTKKAASAMPPTPQATPQATPSPAVPPPAPTSRMSLPKHFDTMMEYWSDKPGLQRESLASTDDVAKSDSSDT